MSSLLQRRLRSIQIACTTWPTNAIWWKCGFVFSGFAALALLIGFQFNFLHVAQTAIPWTEQVMIAGVLFIAPSLLEEVVFRGMLISHPREGALRITLVSQTCFSIVAFVLWHPFNGWAFSPAVWPIFTDPIFLILATLFGLTTTTTYYLSSSIWPPVFIHWLIIMGWVLYFGGRNVLRGTLGI